MTIDIEQLKADRDISPIFRVRLRPFQATTTNARRIARVPDMEARILSDADRIAALEAKVKAADELAELLKSGDIEAFLFSHQGFEPGNDIDAIRMLLFSARMAYREVQS